MKTIIVPIDFSENADTALGYAVEFAKKESALLIVLHAYSVNYPSAEVSYSVMEEIRANAKREAEEQLKNNCLKNIKAGDISFTSIAVEGGAVSVVLETAKEKKADLIIMGTKGAGNVLNQIFGSTAAKVIEKASCPVIAIPSNIVYKPIEKITYATDYLNSDLSNLENIVEFAKPFAAQVNILHIANEGQSPEDDKAMMKSFMEKVNNKISYNNTSFQILNGDNIEQVLEDYLESNSADILAMSAHHRDFFDKILGKSITKHMAYYSTIPLMVFHYNKESAIKLI
jgi:nucleotide-binding universal stress UspA family protein